MSKGEIKFNDLSQLAAALEQRDKEDQENTETDIPAAQPAQSAKKRKEKPVHNTVSENAAEPSSGTGKETGYVPDPLEAEALKSYDKKWRYYATKKEFDDTVAELSHPFMTQEELDKRGNTEGYHAYTHEISAYEKARYETVKKLLGFEHNWDVTPENIKFSEKIIREDKELWPKIQAAHFWNSAGFKPDIQLDENIPNSQTVLAAIKERIDKMEKGSFTDGKYIPSREEKNLLNALHNYGVYPHAREGKDFAKILKDSVARIMRRNDYRTAAESEKPRTKITPPQTNNSAKPKRKDKTEDKKMTDTPENTELATVTEEPYVMNDAAKDALKGFGYEGDGSEIKSKDDYLKTLAKCFHDRLKENRQNPEVSGQLCQDFARTVNSEGFRADPKAIDTFMEMGLLDKEKGQAYYLKDPSNIITPLRRLYENHPEQLKKFLEYNMKKYNESKENKDEKKAEGQEISGNGERKNQPENKNEPQEQTAPHALGVTTFPAGINKQEEKLKETPVAEETKAEEPIPEWIKRKAEWYQSQANQGNISGYEWHKEQKDCFAASVEGSEIRYDNPDNVKVSDDASYKVFDTIMKEEDNKGRPINFPENASKEVATRLYAACVMNGNPMQGAVPKELDEAALQSCGLSAEQVAKVKEQFAKNNGQQQQNEQKKEQPQISEDAKKEMNELSHELMEMQKTGKIKTRKTEDKKVEFLRGDNGNDNDVKTAQDKWNTISKIKETGLSTRQQALSALRKRVADKGDAEIQGKLMDKQKMRDLIHAKRLGLTSESVKDHKGNDVQTLSADKQQAYARNLSNETKARIGYKGNDGR